MKTINLTSNNKILVGTLHVPVEIRFNVPIIIVHGHLATNRIGYYHLYYDIAKELENSGHIVLRFDLSGFGESDVPIEEVNLEDHVSDILLATNFLINEFNADCVNLIAHCVGCTSSTVFTKEHASLVRKLLLINPFFIKEDYIGKLLTASQIEELHNLGHTFRKGFFIHSSFFKGIYTLEEIYNYIQDKTDLIISEFDTYIIHSDLSNLNLDMTVVKEANHDFIEKSTRTELLKIVNNLLS